MERYARDRIDMHAYVHGSYVLFSDAQAEITLLREFARVLLDDDYLRASAMVAKNPTLANLGSASVLDKT